VRLQFHGAGVSSFKTLLAADLVSEDANERGRYHVVSHRVQGFLMLLAGI